MVNVVSFNYLPFQPAKYRYLSDCPARTVEPWKTAASSAELLAEHDAAEREERNNKAVIGPL